MTRTKTEPAKEAPQPSERLHDLLGMIDGTTQADLEALEAEIQKLFVQINARKRIATLMRAALGITLPRKAKKNGDLEGGPSGELACNIYDLVRTQGPKTVPEIATELGIASQAVRMAIQRAKDWFGAENGAITARG